MKIYGRSLLEIVDFAKDIYYCIVVTHLNITITYFLWFFAQFAFYYTGIKILLMNETTYKQFYGETEFDTSKVTTGCISEFHMNMKKKHKRCCFGCIKIRRVFKESFLLYSQRDRSIFEIEMRYIRR